MSNSDFEHLKMRLSKVGRIELTKEGHVFTLFMSGADFTNWKLLEQIQQRVLKYCGDKYPVIEAMKNDTSFLLLILKPPTP